MQYSSNLTIKNDQFDQFDIKNSHFEANVNKKSELNFLSSNSEKKDIDEILLDTCSYDFIDSTNNLSNMNSISTGNSIQIPSK